MDLSAIGRQFGLNDEQTRAALEALTPVVAAGVRRNAGNSQGLQDILSSVLGGQGAGALDDENAVRYDTAKSTGNDILGQIFGSKDVSRGVAQQLSAQSGIGAAVLKQLLPIVASIVMGQVAKKMGGGASTQGGTGGGGLGDILGDILGGGSQRQAEPAPSSPGGSLDDILKDILGGGSAPSEAKPQRRSGPGSDADILLDSVTRSLR